MEGRIRRGRSLLYHIACAASIGLAACATSLVFAQQQSPVMGPRKLSALVPFVGCKSDGQVGPLGAPNGTGKTEPIDEATVRRLAYYQASQGLGVLAPRGWHCFGTYGSAGATLHVSPRPIDATRLLSPNWGGFAGAEVELSVSLGDTSGRFEVAKIIARVFPSRRAYVRKVIAEGIEPANSFPFGSYPKDRLTYKGKNVVEYITPAETDGLGTSSWLLKGPQPISGVAILLGQTPSLLKLSMRLPPELAQLGPVITQQVERDAKQPAHQ